ncbi:hypothetical protein PoB_005734800 [Plakobranchus ocellatus]|uniref:Uncharacterized protein n=1 Tax=Plakobranchus ocellatus TaxID=259542 RepID=A0AAV4CH12_9GAST|nr:hypothetical protein PoB_005734800 [Plakobranchus ocellatus]
MDIWKCECNSSATAKIGGVGGTVASLRSAGTLLSRVRASPPSPWPDRGPESLRSPCCGLAIYTNQPTAKTILCKSYRTTATRFKPRQEITA